MSQHVPDLVKRLQSVTFRVALRAIKQVALVKVRKRLFCANSKLLYLLIRCMCARCLRSEVQTPIVSCTERALMKQEYVS